jgi:hypothetical protein
MGPARCVCLLFLLLSHPALAGFQSEKARMPKKGDTIVVYGCLRGSAIESAQAMTVDEAGEAVEESRGLIPVLTYRLEGSKDILKDLKAKHDRRMVDVKGVLRSELSQSPIGTQVGKTRIVVGLDPSGRGMAGGASQAVPVLEIKSFKGSDVSCGK